MLDPIAGRLEHYLGALAARQKIIASNIANADTPGYRTRDVSFRTELAAAGFGPVTEEVGGLTTKNDGNNVSLDREARLMADTALRFNVATQLIQSQVRATRAAIREGRDG